MAMPEKQWSEPEKWAWEEIRAGRIADFNEHDGHELDPKALDGWNEGRKLRSDFLKEVLFREPYRSAIAVEGMRIVGAWFSDTLDLAHGRVDGQLWLEKCRLDRAANLFGIQVDGWLSLRHCSFKKHGSGAVSVDLGGASITGFVMMQGVTCAGSLRMNGLEVGQSLWMRGPNATFQDVDLGGAKVGSQLDMSGTTVAGMLNMNGLRTGSLLMLGPNATFQEVDLGGARVDGQLALSGATIAGKLTMDSLTVGQSLLMRGPNANFRDVNLRNAVVGGQLAMVGATIAGTLNMNALEVSGALLGGPASLRDVDLTGAKVGDVLSLIGATVIGKLTMDSLTVGGSLFMSEGAAFQDVDLRGAKVGGQLAMIGATVAGTVIMENLEVDRDLFIWNATFQKRVHLVFSRIAGNLELSSADFSGAEFSDFDLSATRIQGELRLGSGDRPPPNWRRGSRLTLRNTHVGILQDYSDGKKEAWPDQLQLDGFTYSRLGGYGARDIHWYITWLARDPYYSPQPYEQLAAVFRAAGEPTKANDLLYAGRERARREARREQLWRLPVPGWRWWGLSLLKWAIGYGIGLRYFRALSWVIVVTLLGTLVLVTSDQGPAGQAAKVVYSLDQLLPIVELANYDTVVITGGVLYYFVAHKLIGWLLGSFLVAGLAGLTQK